MESLKLSIDGMHCQGCASSVATALKALPGVSAQDVKVGSAKVSYDPQRTSADAVIAAINGLGFTARRA